MSIKDSAIPRMPIAVRGGGVLLAGLGVLCFSFTFPATHWSLSGFGPWTTVSVREVLAALIAAGFLLATRARVPERRHWPALAVVAFGVVVGFPVLTTLALQTARTSHASVVIGALPLTTSVMAAAVTRTRHSRLFWAAAGLGTATVVAFALAQSGGAPTPADLLLFAALLACAAGYVAGGRLTAVLPGWQVIGWALVGSLPLTVPGAAFALAAEPARLTGESLFGLLYLAAVSQFFGLLVWYRGMAEIGVPRASQLQLAQPLLTLVWAALLLGERLGAGTALAALAVLLCVAVTQRAR
ncbi:DMT family transporter [Streptacidiphilus monticola]|uniref:DMT family transporter n=1 Tax=Streptacidiphilus monticola TaxID=2161674 RepID=A0ABW1G350_9ACTN